MASEAMSLNASLNTKAMCWMVYAASPQKMMLRSDSLKHTLSPHSETMNIMKNMKHVHAAP